MSNRDLISSVPAGLRPQATSRRVARGSFATTPFPAGGEPTTTIRLPTTIPRNSAAADTWRSNNVRGQCCSNFVMAGLDPAIHVFS